METAVIYARYSTGHNQKEESIEGQIRECTAFAKANDLQIVEIYADRRQSGRSDNREAFQKMLSDSKKKLFSYVIVWKIDRFGRNREEITKNKALLRLNGVKLLSARENIPEGPEGIILEAVLEGLAEYYSANLSQNIKRGMSEAVMKGKYAGSSAVLGYYVDDNNYFQINPAEADAVRKVFDMYDTGTGYTKIAEWLNTSGFKTSRGKPYNCNSVKKLLANRRYIGEYNWSDITGQMPQIVDKDKFERVQEKMKARTVTPRRSGDVDFLLTGKLFCGHCKSPMSGDSGTSKSGEKHYYYTCRGKKQKHNCKKKSVRKEWIESKVARATLDYVLTDEAIDFIAEKTYQIYKKKQKKNSQLAHLKRQLASTEKSLENLLRAIEAGIFGETTKNRMDELEAEKERLQVEIAKEELHNKDLTKDHFVFYLITMKKGNCDKAFLTSILDMFIDSIFLYDDKMLINYKIGDDFDSSEIVELVDSGKADALLHENVRISNSQVHQIRTQCIILTVLCIGCIFVVQKSSNKAKN